MCSYTYSIIIQGVSQSVRFLGAVSPAVLRNLHINGPDVGSHSPLQSRCAEECARY
jgi:hypothetical protein